MNANLDYDKIYEIRLRVGRPLFYTYDAVSYTHLDVYKRQQVRESLTAVSSLVAGLGDLSSMTDSVNQLAEGAKQISEGNEKLQAGYKQLQDTKAAETLTSGADQLLNSEKTITDGINTLQGKDNANATACLLYTSSAKLTEIAKNVAAAKPETMVKSLNQYADGADSLADGVTEYVGKVGEAASGAASVAEGAKSLADGTAALVSGATQVKDGIGKL